MIKTRTLFGIAVVAAVSVLVLSTGGVSSILATHSVDVVTTGPQDAYLGVEQTLLQTKGNTTDLELTVTNQFPAGIVLTTVEVTTNGTTVDLTTRGRLEPGDNRTHTFRAVSCGETLIVESSSADTSVQINQSVSCP